MDDTKSERKINNPKTHQALSFAAQVQSATSIMPHPGGILPPASRIADHGNYPAQLAPSFQGNETYKDPSAHSMPKVQAPNHGSVVNVTTSSYPLGDSSKKAVAAQAFFKDLVFDGSFARSINTTTENYAVCVSQNNIKE